MKSFLQEIGYRLAVDTHYFRYFGQAEVLVVTQVQRFFFALRQLFHMLMQLPAHCRQVLFFYPFLFDSMKVRKVDLPGKVIFGAEALLMTDTVYDPVPDGLQQVVFNRNRIPDPAAVLPEVEK